MAKKDQKDNKVEAVLNLLQKQAPLTLKQVSSCIHYKLANILVLGNKFLIFFLTLNLIWVQEKFCSIGCVERFLKVRGENVKKAAKQLRACLSWRDSISIGTNNNNYSSFLYFQIYY